MRLALLYLATLTALLAADAVWLATMGPTLYAREIGALLLPQPNLAVAGGFYLIYPLGLLLLAVLPGLTDARLAGALWRAALLGLCAYGTYDLSNLATLKGWTALITAVDLTWGVVVSMLASAAGYAAGRIGRR